MAPIQLGVNIYQRFIQSVVLLYLIDPVRGEPTTHGLDRHPHDTNVSRESQLLRKFVDSIALIAATEKDASTVSAAFMDEGSPDGTIMRVASNAGVSDDTLCQLRTIISLLNEVAAGGKKYQILSKIYWYVEVDVAMAKISQLKEQRTSYLCL
jgi:hypothetical protein